MNYKNLGTPHKTDSLALYNCDCMELLRQTPDNYYELCVVDPPYGIDAAKMGLGKGVGTESRTWENKDWDQSIPDSAYFKELKRVSKNQIIWGANYFPDMEPTPCWIIWDKMQEFSGATFEMAWTSFKSPAKAFRMARATAYCNREKIHPTQKPHELYDWIFANYAEKGMKILDTHMGSGSIAIAAHYAGMHLTACELDEDYYKAACERIERETAQQTFL